MAPEMLVVLLACVLLVPGAAGSNLHINLCYSCDKNCQDNIEGNEAYFDDVTEALKKRMDTLNGYKFTLHNTRVVEWPFKMNHKAAFVYGCCSSWSRLWWLNNSFWNFKIGRKGSLWQLFKDTFKCDVGVNVISHDDDVWKKDNHYLKCIKSISGGRSAGDREICRESYITTRLDTNVDNVSSWIARSLGTLLGIYLDGYMDEYNQAKEDIYPLIDWNGLGYAEQQLRYGYWKTMKNDCRGFHGWQIKWMCDGRGQKECIMFPYPNNKQKFSECSKAYLDLHFLIVRLHPSKFPKACLEKKKDG